MSYLCPLAAFSQNSRDYQWHTYTYNVEHIQGDWQQSLWVHDEGTVAPHERLPCFGACLSGLHAGLGSTFLASVRPDVRHVHLTYMAEGRAHTSKQAAAYVVGAFFTVWCLLVVFYDSRDDPMYKWIDVEGREPLDVVQEILRELAKPRHEGEWWRGYVRVGIRFLIE